MHNKYKNLILWFSTLPLVTAMAAYGTTKDVELTALLTVMTLPVSGFGVYKTLIASKKME